MTAGDVSLSFEINVAGTTLLVASPRTGRTADDSDGRMSRSTGTTADDTGGRDGQETVGRADRGTTGRIT